MNIEWFDSPRDKLRFTNYCDYFEIKVAENLNKNMIIKCA